MNTRSIQQVQQVMKLTYGVVPIVAGLDKFTNFLADWPSYLHPALRSVMNPHSFMAIVGLIEIVAGILVLARPKIGATVVAAWLVLIGVSLLASGNYLDVAVRDIVMGVGAYGLAQLSAAIDPAERRALSLAKG